MKDKARKPTTTPGSEPSPAEGAELPERWSVQRRRSSSCGSGAARRLTRSRCESQVPPMSSRARSETSSSGNARLKTRSDPEERELTLARAKIGGLMMRLELA